MIAKRYSWARDDFERARTHQPAPRVAGMMPGDSLAQQDGAEGPRPLPSVLDIPVPADLLRPLGVYDRYRTHMNMAAHTGVRRRV